MQFNKNESNPMLLGYMELINDDRKALQDHQKRLNEEMKAAEEIKELMEQNKKEMLALQLQHQQKINEAMKANPSIHAIMEEMAADRKAMQEHQQLFEKEMLRATYMSPVIITPTPELDERGNAKLTKESKIQFPALATPNGLKLMMAFTDKKEFQKWEKAGESSTLSLSMRDFIAMVLKKDSELNGMVINPYGINLVIPKEKLEEILKTATGGKQQKTKNVETVEANDHE